MENKETTIIQQLILNASLTDDIVAEILNLSVNDKKILYPKLKKMLSSIPLEDINEIAINPESK